MLMDTKTIMTKVTFISKIANMGERKKIIAIPKDFWGDVEQLEDERRLKVTIEDVLDE